MIDLQRNGMRNNGTFDLIDDLTITYDGNQLVKVTDAAEALNYNGALDFNDGANADSEYQYDSNGALTKDSNRGINSITYDYGHHPYKFNMNMASGPRSIQNDYTPDGRKLSSRHVMSFPKLHGYTKKTTTDLYIDGLILRNGKPLMWQFDGGYVSLNANATPTSWNYYITDHLGSTRKVVDSNNNTKETINYYPFGSEMRIQDPALIQQTDNNWHPFRFTGKELDKQNGLNMYDFGARWFDVAGVPMWTSVDPLAEKHYPFTPYSYCAGDPVNRIDPDGRDDYYTKGGDYLGTNNAETDNIYVSDEGQYRQLEDGKYAINVSSRVALDDAELDAEAYSKIFTNSFRLAGGDCNKLADGKIQVTVWQTEGGNNVTYNYTENSGVEGGALASTALDHTNGAQITAYIFPKGTDERELFSTRSNIASTLKDHEFKGHYENGFTHTNGTPDQTYKMQMESPIWNKTTPQFKEYHNKVIKQNGYGW